jgi:g-D-glutamyl-meso-diaminopimelate peptidase
MDVFDEFYTGYIVPTDINLTSAVLASCIHNLHARYPFLHVHTAGASVMGRPLYLLKIGDGPNKVFYNAAHHANEWITSLLLLRFIESYAKKCAFGGKIFDIDCQSVYSKTTLSLMPMVNPDGVDLVTGALTKGDYFERAEALSKQYPDIPFPTGWKANIRGVDLNLQYPAGWENARAIKYSQGVMMPGPRDYIGSSPLSEPESRAVYDLTRSNDFSLTLSFHTQGKTIYWKYLDYEIKNSYDIAQKFASFSGYEVEETPLVSGYAGYKDWFISTYNRPGYTIEAGEGISPLPLSQFPQIYEDCLGIMTLGLL